MPRPGTLWERGASNSRTGAAAVTPAGAATVATRVGAWCAAAAAGAGWGAAPPAGGLYSAISPDARSGPAEPTRPPDAGRAPDPAALPRHRSIAQSGPAS